MSAATIHAGDCTDLQCAATYGQPLGAAVFVCPGCERTCGWCFGCGGDMPELCDDCWCDVTEKREANIGPRAVGR